MENKFEKINPNEQEKYPIALKVTDLMKILDTSDTTIYLKLKKGEIPGARKIPGIGWRINRDEFLNWLYSF
ncbi:MAG: helix-turn-helix domain-containing protein [Candidatus Woesearchaeota archaeon]